MPFSRLKLSPFCIPLPPEITTSAAVNSGRSDSAISSFIKDETPRSVSLSSSSTLALPPDDSQASNPVVLTVITLIESLLLTVAIQFPA